MVLDQLTVDRLRSQIYQIQSQQRRRIESLYGGSLDTEMAESVAELSSVDQHTSDLANETLERSKDLGLLAQSEYVLAACAEALDRIEAGSYGVCESCDRAIPVARLEALPYVTRCVECQEEEDQRHPYHRPVEEEVISFRARSGFGKGDDQIDRDDAWEIVAQHGTANTPQDTPDAFDDDADGEEKGNG